MPRRVVAILLSAWLLAGCMRPAPIAPGAATAAATPGAAQPAPATAAVPISPGETPPPGPAPAGSSPLFPGLDLALDTDLDAGSPQGRLYVISLDPAFGSEAGSLRLAAQLDVAGSLYRSTASDRGFLILDGVKRLRTSGAHPVFELDASPPQLRPAPNCAPPCPADGAAGSIETFLKDRGLLDFEYLIRPAPGIPRQVEIFELLDGAALISPYGPAVTALTGESGELLWLRGNLLGLEPGESRKLRSAEAAWQALQDGSAGAIFQDYTRSVIAPRTWSRHYPTGVDLAVFGEALVYEPLPPGGDPLIALNAYRVSGAPQGLAEAAKGGRLIQAWGRATEDGADGPQLALSGWQASVYPERIIEGRLARDGREAYLETDAARFHLPDAPAEIAAGAWLTARGVTPEAEEPILQWWTLTEGPAQRLRSGGPGFKPLSLDAAGASRPSPLTGRIAGVQGFPQVIVHAYADGSSQVEVQFLLAAEDGTRTQTRARLDGPGLQGIEAYQNLPLRIWGRAGETASGLATIEVERFEPVDPQARLEAWLGMAEKAQANGQPVWLATTPEGESFVLASTLSGKEPAVDGSLLRDPIIVEGVQIPGKELLGFPIIDDLLILPGVGRNDLEGYQPVSAQPRIIQEPGAAGARRAAHVEAAELVYVLTTETGQLAPTVNAAALAQPAWRFSGRFADGASFEIYVQAVFDV